MALEHGNGTGSLGGSSFYRRDPIRSRLAPKLGRLMEASGAEYCAFAWCEDDRPSDFHPDLVLGAEAGARPPSNIDRVSRKEALGGRLSGGQTRANKWAGVFLAERAGRSWFLFLHSPERLTVGRGLGREAEVALWGATWAVARIGEAEPTADLDPQALLAEGEAAEEASAFDDAVACYGRACEVSLATGDLETAVYSTWYRGRALRKLARWDDAMGCYETAREAALEAGRMGLVALITVGMANVRLHKGALGDARRLYQDVVEVGGKANNRQAVAQGYFGLVLVESQEKDWRSAARAGWRAYAAARGLSDEWDILVTLGTCFRMLGRMDEARSCNVVAMKGAPLGETRQLATCNLAILSALEGDERAFSALMTQVDPTAMSTMARVEVLAERGQALCALGRDEEGRRALRDALGQAEKLKFGKLVFDIESALELARPWEPLMGPDLIPRDAEEHEIRTQLELIATGV